MPRFCLHGLDVLTQTGHVHYTESQNQATQMQAWANSARYTPADQMLVLNENPRVEQGGMATTADRMRINRLTGEALAEGTVKSTYSELKEQPSGALLASSSPIHVTASNMTTRSNPAGVAVYSGDVRLWQDANMIQAPTIQFDRNHRAVVAEGSARHPVKTTLVESEKTSLPENGGKSGQKGTLPAPSTPITITGLKLTYVDSERKIHYRGRRGRQSCRVHRIGRHARRRPPPQKPNHFESDPCSARATRSDHRPRQRRDPAAEPPGGRPEAGLHGGREQVCPERRTS